jgi:hypothetical protein
MPATIMVLIAMTTLMACLAVYRWMVTRHEDDFLHLEDPTGELLLNQRETAKSLKKVDRLGIALTVITALYGIGLLVMYLVNGLNYHPLA